MNKPASHFTAQDLSGLFHEHRWIPWLILLGDLIAMQLALVAGYFLRVSLARWWPIAITSDQYHGLMFAMLLVPLGFWLLKLYPGYGLSLVERFRRKVRATFIFFFILSVWEYLATDETWSRGVFLFTWLFALIFTVLLQSILRYLLIRRNVWGTPVIILGGGSTGRAVVKAINDDPSLGLRPIAVLDDKETLWGESINGVPVVGGFNASALFVKSVKHAILAMPESDRDTIVTLSEFLPFPTITIIPDLLGLQTLWVEVRDLGGIPGMEIQRQLLLKRNLFIKHCMDYILGIPLFLLSIPVLIISALCIKLTSPGPAIFTQTREGSYGNPIQVIKLRTMYLDAEQLLERHLAENPAAREEWQKHCKLKNDPRILPFIGTFLRKTSLDELPQLWNVLRGDMSLVGPRPFPYYHLDKFSEAFRHLRRRVTPGLTGLWQVSARSDGDLAVQERLDTYYIRNWSIWHDILILAKTIRIVMTGKGAY